MLPSIQEGFGSFFAGMASRGKSNGDPPSADIEKNDA